MNFGYRPGRGTEVHVAGTPIKDEGFVVCTSCGKVRDPDRGHNLRIEHAPWCKFRDTKLQEKFEPVCLYREVRSEAIRVLLPVAAVEVDETRASFQAALQLGFRRKFQGNPGHLLIKALKEPVAGAVKAWRTYVVIYDAVPGGTGYLTELSNDGSFMNVLELARDAIKSCPCRQDARKDGCYRCLYAYQSQYDLPRISARKALQLLNEILAHKDQLHEVATLSDVDIHSRIESELEQRFIDALRHRAARTPDMKLEETVHQGKLCWKLSLAPPGRPRGDTGVNPEMGPIDGAVPPSPIAQPRQVGDLGWRIEPQVDVGPGQRVGVASRPDFLFTCISGIQEHVPSVAVFCDGFEYHA
ncbi:MAG: DUF1998 domain-containing protein, partial [Candidatus Xenobia bacterium]